MKKTSEIIHRLRRKIRDTYSLLIKSSQTHLIKKFDRSYVTIYHDYEGEYAWPGVKKISYTAVNRILDIEKDYGIKATYNTVGKLINDTPLVIKRIINEGHELASHSYSHGIMSDMSLNELEQDIYYFKQLMKKNNIPLNGVRSPQSKWSHAQMRVMANCGLKWSAENDKADYPYVIKKCGDKRLIRMPITMDDWNYISLNWSSDKMFTEMLKMLDSAIDNRNFAAFGFHPWVLGEDVNRMQAFDKFIEVLMNKKNISIVTFNEMSDIVNSQCAK